jgi:putative nucleotidyltransferase with HDIG domain
MDDAYVGGILHDMGKIIFSNVHPELLGKIKSFCADKAMPSSTLEDLTAGMNHAEIGSMVAEKWNFPEQLVHAIQFHHDPLSTVPEERNLIYTVYLANMLCEYENGNISIDQFDSQVLNNFNIDSKKQIDSILELFSAGFNKER